VESPPTQPRPDYPRTPSEFAEFFPDEAACERYLDRLRWPLGFVCPKCRKAADPWRTARGPLCRFCRSRASLTAGTVLEGTHKPLRFWLSVAWEMAGRPGGVNARTIQRLLGLGSYQTAWSWLHKLRRAMAPANEQLVAPIVVGKVRLSIRSSQGGKRRGARYATVGVAVERVGTKRIGRIKLERLRRSGARAFAERVGAATSEPPTRDDAVAVRRVGSILQRWILDTYQGGVSLDHLDHYLDEFAFRFNARRAASRGLRFRSLLESALHTETVTTRELFQVAHD
jgi:hypothetical protein